MNALRGIGNALVRLFSSFGLSVVLLVLLGVLTFLGTIAQVDHSLYDVQKRYFESWFLVHQLSVGGDRVFALPLPGATLLLTLLAVNLLFGGLWRLRGRRNVAGVAIVHVGILILFAAGLVKLVDAEDGHTTLYEGQSADFFQSYHEYELVLHRPRGDGVSEERVVPARRFSHAIAGSPVTIRAGDLPFDIEIQHWFPNASVGAVGPHGSVPVPVVDGHFIRPRPKAQQNEQNVPAAYVDILERDGTRSRTILWLFQQAPYTFEAGGERFALDLRRERYPLPFSVRLDKFMKEDHPRTGMARWFSSDVAVERDGATKLVTISMNEPMRTDGLVFYQASWGPADARPGDPLFSTLAVSRNPSDQWPLIGCLVITAGLLLHFGRKLLRHLARERVAT
jgi:hypothetical protein